MAAILTTITAIVTAALGWVGDFAGLVTKQTVAGTFDYPILILFIVLPLVGLGIGLFKRLMNT